MAYSSTISIHLALFFPRAASLVASFTLLRLGARVLSSGASPPPAARCERRPSFSIVGSLPPSSASAESRNDTIPFPALLGGSGKWSLSLPSAFSGFFFGAGSGSSTASAAVSGEMCSRSIWSMNVCALRRACRASSSSCDALATASSSAPSCSSRCAFSAASCLSRAAAIAAAACSLSLRLRSSTSFLYVFLANRLRATACILTALRPWNSIFIAMRRGITPALRNTFEYPSS
mmetsp:Transcript_31081/g.75528  ORF Transcript_31081/g.75528 Transcript_31081/m.75528 type:complete len:234 (-) Transcript_31081:2722-3423(-)